MKEEWGSDDKVSAKRNQTGQLSRSDNRKFGIFTCICLALLLILLFAIYFSFDDLEEEFTVETESARDGQMTDLFKDEDKKDPLNQSEVISEIELDAILSKEEVATMEKF